MSRIGKMPVPVPSGVEIEIQPGLVRAKGSNGTLEAKFPAMIEVAREDDQLVLTRPSDAREHKAFHGLARALVANIVHGVSTGFEKNLEIQGVGYRAALQGTTLVLQVGYSHPVEMPAPEGITFEVPTPTQDRREGRQQGTGRTDRGEHPQGPAARALQGQGHPVRR